MEGIKYGRTWHLLTLPEVPGYPCAPLANALDLNPIENLLALVKGKMQDTRFNNTEELRVTIRATWASVTPQQCYRWINSTLCHIAVVIHAKGAPILLIFFFPHFRKISATLFVRINIRVLLFESND